MKRIIFAVVMFFSMCQVFAGSKYDFSMLKGETKINVDYDWKSLTIDGKNVSDWLDFRQAEQPKWDARKELKEDLKPQIDEMISTANKELRSRNMFLKTKCDAKYTLKLIPQNITKKGNNVIKCQLVETSKRKIVQEFTVEGKGGVFGSMGNLWGDGFRDAGKKLGKMIKKGLK